MIKASGDNITTQVEGMQRNALVALKAAVAGATEYAKAKMRERIRERSSSPRLPNIIGSAVYPKDGLSYGPSGSIFPRGSKAALILEQMAEGATITAKGKKALAIPLHNQRGGDGKLRQPKDFPTLVFIPSRQRGGVTVGVLALPSSKTRRGLLDAKSRKAQAAKSRARVQGGIGDGFIAMFVLVRTIRIPRVFDADAILKEAVAQMPGLFESALARQAP